MATYHLHARLFQGSLLDPIRNELQSRESDSFAEVQKLGEQLSARGFAVWVYEHGQQGPHAHGESGYRVIAEWGADGQRRRPHGGPTSTEGEPG